MTRLSLLCVVVIALLSACGSSDLAANKASNAPRIVTSENAEVAAMPASATVASRSAGQNADQANNRQPAAGTKISLNKAEETYAAERKIIRNAELNLESENPEDAQRRITALAELRGGFVVESQQSGSEVQSTMRDIVTMTVRVPADKFADTLADIRNVSTRVVLETVKGQDVTEEFIDIEAQLRAKKALEQQFMEIMKRANTVDDALTVQSQLSGVRGEIERIEGRKRFLENQSSMSTIKVRLQTPKVFAASSTGFGDRLYDSFAAGSEVAIGFVLGVITFAVAALPFVILIGLPVFVIVRYGWRRQARMRSVIELADDELKST